MVKETGLCTNISLVDGLYVERILILSEGAVKIGL
jgi:hypothetical protein